MTLLTRFATATLAATLWSAQAAAQRATYDLTGRWAFTVVTENGTGTPAVTFTQRGDSLSGTYTSGRMGDRALTGTVRKDTVTFVLKGGEVELRFTGRMTDADNIAGTLEMGGMGQATFTGKREKK
jgi:hypothetical protein